MCASGGGILRNQGSSTHSTKLAAPLIHPILSVHPSMYPSVHPYRPPQAFVFRRPRRRLPQWRAVRLLVVTRVRLAGRGSFTIRHSSVTHCRTNPFHCRSDHHLHDDFSLQSPLPLHCSQLCCLRQWQIAKGARGHGQLTLSHLLANKQRNGGATDGRTDGRNQMCGEIEKLGEGRKGGRKEVLRLEE